jgi:phage virion morphogenesis protein
MIEFEIDDGDIQKALRKLQQKTGNISPALRKIGENMTESTKKRFETYTGPDGVMWEANSDVTYDRKADRSGIPLTDHGTLGNTIHYKLFGNEGLAIGSPMKYAAMMQFGGTKSEFPNLWGDIPARPFLGVSDDDAVEILNIIGRHLDF